MIASTLCRLSQTCTKLELTIGKNMVTLSRTEETDVHLLRVLRGLLCYIDYIALLHDNAVSRPMKNKSRRWKKNPVTVITLLFLQLMKYYRAKKYYYKHKKHLLCSLMHYMLFFKVYIVKWNCRAMFKDFNS